MTRYDPNGGARARALVIGVCSTLVTFTGVWAAGDKTTATAQSTAAQASSPPTSTPAPSAVSKPTQASPPGVPPSSAQTPNAQTVPPPTSPAAKWQAQKKAAAAAPVKLIDINSASREELKTLPGIGDAEAGRIVAGRPYYSKADLATNNVLPTGVYLSIRKQIIAKQSGKPVPKK